MWSGFNPVVSCSTLNDVGDTVPWLILCHTRKKSNLHSKKITQLKNSSKYLPIKSTTYSYHIYKVLLHQGAPYWERKLAMVMTGKPPASTIINISVLCMPPPTRVLPCMLILSLKVFSPFPFQEVCSYPTHHIIHYHCPLPTRVTHSESLTTAEITFTESNFIGKNPVCVHYLSTHPISAPYVR